mgnify:CR=1 FL=1
MEEALLIMEKLSDAGAAGAADTHPTTHDRSSPLRMDEAPSAGFTGKPPERRAGGSAHGNNSKCFFNPAKAIRGRVVAAATFADVPGGSGGRNWMVSARTDT